MSEITPIAFPTNSWHPGAPGFPVLFDRYQILGILGEGGMGTVYKGYHLNLKRFVAIKVLRHDRTRKTDLVSRFLSEMESIGRLNHTNIVRADDAGQKNGVLFLVMEYLDGADLHRVIREHGALDVADACELVRQAAEGLACIHRQMVHRDIKPSNLMLTREGLVKILDLGLARLEEIAPGDRERTPEGHAVGTYDYMAPEQAAGRAVQDARADIYSLGCTLFALLTGHPPFTGPGYDSAAKKLFAQCHVPLSKVEGFGTLPADLRPILLRMTAKAAEERYTTAAEVARALAPFTAGSRPTLLLVGDDTSEEAALRPLPAPLPAELSRLTTVPTETSLPPDTPIIPPVRRRAWPWLVLPLCAGLMVAAAWLLLTALTPPDEITEPIMNVEPPTIDTLTPELPFELLREPEFPPVLIGYKRSGGLALFKWTRSQRKVKLTPAPGNTVLVELGTTARPTPSYRFQTHISQSTWQGQVGLFWGYQEDAALKKARKPGLAFAKFQALVVTEKHEPGLAYYVVRERITLQHGADRSVILKSQDEFEGGADLVNNLSGDPSFAFDIVAGKLTAATFAGTNLRRVCSSSTNGNFTKDDYRGAFGLISLSADVTIRYPVVALHADN